MPDPNDIIAVYHGANVTEAHLVKNLLLEEGIEARVADEFEVFGGLGIDTPDVLVHVRDRQRAEAIVAQYEERQFERAERAEAESPDDDEDQGADESPEADGVEDDALRPPEE